MSDRLCACGTAIRNGKCAWGHVDPDAPTEQSMRRLFDEARERVKPLVNEALEAERIRPKIMNMRFR